MKRIQVIVVFTIFSLILLYVYIIIERGIVSDNVFPLWTDSDENDSFAKTYSKVGYKTYPSNLTLTRVLLGKYIGEKYMHNGILNYSAICVKKSARLGNNIYQLSNAVYLSEIMNISTIYIPHDFCLIKNVTTTSKGIKIIPVKGIPKGSLDLGSSIFKMSDGEYYPEDRVREFAHGTLKSIPPVDINDKGLYIHVRSGDIFKVNPCPLYGQPPMCFYDSIIEKWNFKDIYVLSEDTKNPVINQLIKKYNATFIKTDLTKTIGFILKANNLVMSYGTFLPSLLKLVPENPEKRIFRYGNNMGFLSVVWKKFYYIDVSTYYSKNILKNNWNNTEEQREIMMNETCGNEWKISMYTTFS